MTRANWLLIPAILCFVVATLLEATVLNGANPLTWAFAGLAFFAAAHLPIP